MAVRAEELFTGEMRPLGPPCRGERRARPGMSVAASGHRGEGLLPEIAALGLG
jgi:hypothetical protein